ncbi:helix-turn-helix transcriptional regulator [Bifidobacterium callitrichos]|uniref:Helix-turn-helix domain-containing protein n=1 Tax=Bifidobacterium callitrichos DSM 23973 TaxID=1437609 RepID=A0A086ZY52_9BIFI|nr:helix-turn-helix domain-containing protein [Bifidobacterium callitrichos]KFI51452.1 hypothetical protein BCAL_1185 [Bifidobacterium callitrichos DSM 23973]
MTQTATPAIAITSDDVWMTPREAAEYAHTTTGTLSTLRWTKNGPKFYKPTSRRVLYRKSDLDDWIMGGTK